MPNTFSLLQLIQGNVGSPSYSDYLFGLSYLFFFIPVYWLSTLIILHLALCISQHGCCIARRTGEIMFRTCSTGVCLKTGSPLLGQFVWPSESDFQFGHLLGKCSWCWPVFRIFWITYYTFSFQVSHSVHCGFIWQWSLHFIHLSKGSQFSQTFMVVRLFPRRVIFLHLPVKEPVTVGP